MYRRDWLDVFGRILFIGLIGLLIFLLGMILFEGIHFGESSTQEVYATVIDKEYTPSRTEMYPVSTGKTVGISTRYISADYGVLAEYEGYRKWIDSEEIYNSTEIGDSIPLTLVTWYKKDGSIRKQFLTE